MTFEIVEEKTIRVNRISGNLNVIKQSARLVLDEVIFRAEGPCAVSICHNVFMQDFWKEGMGCTIKTLVDVLSSA